MKKKIKTELISLELPSSLLKDIKEIAYTQDISYKSLIKVFIAEAFEEYLVKHQVTNK